MLQKDLDLNFVLQYGPILAVFNSTKTNIRIRIFHTIRYLSLDINYSSRFLQYPHHPIACCLPHLSTVAHNCHGKCINLTAKRKKTHDKKNNLTMWQKEKDSCQKEKPHGKKKKTRSKKKTSQQKEKDSWQIFFDTERTVKFLFLLP